MIRPRLVNVLTVIVIALGAGGILGGYIAFGQYAASEHQGRNEAIATIHEKNATINKKDAQLSRLFNNYVKSVNDCAQAADCTSTTPDPDVVQQIIEGTPGATGATGPGATDAQVFLQVENYCQTTLLCKGDTGSSGSPGTNGTNGADGAKGDKGDKGDTGDAGAPGRGVTDVSCVSNGDLTTSFRFTFTDGSTEDIPGMCLPQ